MCRSEELRKQKHSISYDDKRGVVPRHLETQAFRHGTNNMATATEFRYIVRDGDILGGEPIIEGTRTPVRHRGAVASRGYARGDPHPPSSSHPRPGLHGVGLLRRSPGGDPGILRPQPVPRGPDSPGRIHGCLTPLPRFTSTNRIHFERLHGEWLESGRPHAGIIIARRRAVREIAARVGRLRNRLPSDACKSQLLSV